MLHKLSCCNSFFLVINNFIRFIISALCILLLGLFRLLGLFHLYSYARSLNNPRSVPPTSIKIEKDPVRRDMAVPSLSYARSWKGPLLLGLFLLSTKIRIKKERPPVLRDVPLTVRPSLNLSFLISHSIPQPSPHFCISHHF